MEELLMDVCNWLQLDKWHDILTISSDTFATDNKCNYKERAENLADYLPPEELGPWCK